MTGASLSLPFNTGSFKLNTCKHAFYTPECLCHAPLCDTQTFIQETKRPHEITFANSHEYMNMALQRHWASENLCSILWRKPLWCTITISSITAQTMGQTPKMIVVEIFNLNDEALNHVLKSILIRAQMGSTVIFTYDPTKEMQADMSVCK